MFCGKITPLREFSQGTYALNAAKRVNNCKFGKQYMLSLGEEDNQTIVISDTSKKLQEAEDLKHLDVDGNYLSIRNKKLGTLRITGKGTIVTGRTTLYCQIIFNPREEKDSTQMKKASEDIVEYTPIIPRKNMLNYREYPNLVSFPVDTVCNVDGWGYIQHYGRERLVVSVDGKFYQAGKYLEENVNQLKHLCKIKIEKVRTDKNGNVKYAICSLYEKGDWTAVVKYEKVPILPQKKMDGKTCVLDVR